MEVTEIHTTGKMVSITYGAMTLSEGTEIGIIDVNTSIRNDDSGIINAALSNAGLSSNSYNYVMTCPLLIH